jgi:hypothetical protein
MELPEEMLVGIMSFASPFDRQELSRVNRAWNQPSQLLEAGRARMARAVQRTFQ